jgi:TseV toxin immunity protein TsiV
MTPRYPRLRYRGRRPVVLAIWKGETPHPAPRELLARDVVRIAFYLPYDHPEIASGVSHAVESYLRAVGQGPRTINHCYINDDEGATLSEERWSSVRFLLRPERPYRFIEELSEPTARDMEKRGYAAQLVLTGAFRSTNGYELWYRARIPSRTPPPDYVSYLTATLPTDYLEKHGATRVRELALEMASQLRFTTGHAGLALHLYSPLVSIDEDGDEDFRSELLCYPGIDLRPAWLRTHWVGSHVDGIHWLNFLGPPVIGQLGRAAALRSRLSPRTLVHELDAERVVVSLGEEPEAGDLSAGQDLPEYRELARVLAPWLEPPRMVKDDGSGRPPRQSDLRLTLNEAQRWWRRFLD